MSSFPNERLHQIDLLSTKTYALLKAHPSHIYSEIKAVPDSRDFEGGFAALKKIVPKAKCFCVYSGEVKRVSDGYQIIPYKDFLN
jgi:hypothetical protein